MELVPAADVSSRTHADNCGADAFHARPAEVFGATLRLLLLLLLFALGITLGWCGHWALDGRARINFDQGWSIRIDHNAPFMNVDPGHAIID